MTPATAIAEIRLAARVCRDLFPNGRLGPFLFALAHDADAGRRTVDDAYELARSVISVAARSMS